jgi:phosphomannomutase
MPVDPTIFKAYDVRGLVGEQIDGDVAQQIGRAFARVIGELAGKPVADCRLALGRDMRIQAPELAARYRDGMRAEGAHVVDAGQVGSEMLYWLVGSRELDGGLMCTASHNPKAYTGAKLVREGAIALSGDSGIGDVRDLVCGDGLGDPPGGGTHEEVEIYGTSPTTSRTRCCPRTAGSSSTRSARPAPTSASRGTATPIAASSSTVRVSSSTATS